MSDSFADLWRSTAPSQPQQAIPLSQQKSSNSQSNNKAKQDVFALLSQSTSTSSYYGGSNLSNNARTSSSLSTSAAGSRSITPSLSAMSSVRGAPSSRPASALSSTSNKPSSGGDAFSDLLSGHIGGTSNGRAANLTIAERAALVEKQRLASQTRAPAPSPSHGHWAGLDALGGEGTSFSKPRSTTSSEPPAAKQEEEDDWGLGDFGAASHKKPQPEKRQQTKAVPAASGSLLGFGGFDAAPNAPTNPSKPPSSQSGKSRSLLDLDDFAEPAAAPQHPQPSRTQQKDEHLDLPDFDFDFGNREDQDFGSSEKATSSLLDSPRVSAQHDEDDILGMLSKPVGVVRAKQQAVRGDPSRSSGGSTPQPRKTDGSRSSSPPPHVLGQLVEMGFSIPQARAALAKTDTGVDVQAALEMLLAEAATDTTEDSDPRPPRRAPVPERSYADEEERLSAGARRRPPREGQAPAESGTPNLQEQADKLIAQASEVGLSVLTKASFFWNQGKEKVQKVYEERTSTGDRPYPNRAPAVRDGRPKWMQDTNDDTHNTAHNDGDRYESSFSDDHNPYTSFRDGHDEIPSRKQRAPSSSSAARPSLQPHAQPEIDLFSSSAPPPQQPSEPKIYVSPFRRKKVGTVAELPQASLSASAFASSSSSVAPPRPKPKRRLPSCPPSTLTAVRQHKTRGTDAFKLGQFSVAADEYSKAVALLPDGHFLLVPLHTNRALARIRCGECKGAVEDAVSALAIIGGREGQGKGTTWETWNPSEEDGGWELDGGDAEQGDRGGYDTKREKGAEWGDVWGRGVDLKDGWVKAVRRRAEALEGMEKWKEAKKDWEVLAGGGGGGWVDAKTREEAVRGLGRCKKMLLQESGDGDPSASKPPPPKVKPRPRPVVRASSVVVAEGTAVKAYRAQVTAMEAEDALKYSLKDTVDARLLSWKKGKETNLRALLASLENILWEDLIKDMGGKPGLADLVSGGGVKKWYMKAVARVHPDKLNANNSTVEQRMIAGGVFGTLNEAWLAFKQ